LSRRSFPALLFLAALVLAPSGAVLAGGTEGPGGGRENQPPVLVASIPLQAFPEDNLGNKGYRLVNLSKHFTDDGETGDLTFSVVYASNPSHICATVDGWFLSFSTPTPDWYGQERFRLRATDAEGLWTESNDFTVRVTPVSKPLRILLLPVLEVFKDWERYFDITPYLQSDYHRPEDIVITTNEPFVRVEGRVLFIRVPGETAVETIFVNVTANVLDDEAHAGLKLVVLFDPWYVPYPPVTFFHDITIREDGLFVEYLQDIGPLNPDATWNVTGVQAGSPPIFEATLMNATMLKIAGALHRYGEGGLSAVASVPKGLKFHHHFNVTVLAEHVDHRLARINDTTVTEHRNVSFWLIIDDVWSDLVFWTDSPFFNITRDGWVNFTPDQREVGSWRINYTVSIGRSDPARRSFNLTVLNVNEPPENVIVLRPENGSRFREGQWIAFAASSYDIDGDIVSYRWYESDGREHAGGGEWQTAGLDAGTHSIFVRVSDGEYTADSPAVVVMIDREPKTTVEDGSGTAFIVAMMILVVVLATSFAVIAGRKRGP